MVHCFSSNCPLHTLALRRQKIWIGWPPLALTMVVYGRGVTSIVAVVIDICICSRKPPAALVYPTRNLCRCEGKPRKATTSPQVAGEHSNDYLVKGCNCDKSARFRRTSFLIDDKNLRGNDVLQCGCKVCIVCLTHCSYQNTSDIMDILAHLHKP